MVSIQRQHIVFQIAKIKCIYLIINDKKYTLLNASRIKPLLNWLEMRLKFSSYLLITNNSYQMKCITYKYNVSANIVNFQNQSMEEAKHKIPGICILSGNCLKFVSVNKVQIS